jgi:hypothetical protein
VTRVTAYETSVRFMGSPREVTDHVKMQVERSRSASRGSHAAYHVFPFPLGRGNMRAKRKQKR